MPKRLLDSSLFTSPSLARLSPRAQDAFPRLILCADDFGCFDATPRALVGLAWPLRDDVTQQDVEAWLGELVAAGMAQLWEQAGRRYCYLTGWTGPHGQRRREEYHRTKAPHGSKRRTPPPPAREPGGTAAGDSKCEGEAVPARAPRSSRASPASAGAVAGADTAATTGTSGGDDAAPPRQPKPAPAPAPPSAKGLPAAHEWVKELDEEHALLAALPGLIVDLAATVRRPVAAVEGALRALRQRGAVRAVQRGTPPVVTWERVEPQPAVKDGA